MIDTAVRVENLSKLYHIGGPQARYRTLRESLVDAALAPARRLRRLGQPPPEDETIWALKDVTFDVKKGEAIGIIGHNGAGKTTLLKILSRITEPTNGHAEIKGRVGSLLEVGTGFHPELTGRENIYLNGAILGMKRAEIDDRFDEIVDFSEIEKFLDTPVKRYSSGMYVRLAFSVAAHLKPEILLVDEVLAVGDAAFQRKCIGKMGDVSRAGRTVIFVSHNLTAVKGLCEKAVLLCDGTVASMGDVNQVVNEYLSTNQPQVLERVWDSSEPAPGYEDATVRSVRVVPDSESLHGHMTVETPFDVEFVLRILKPARLNLSMHVKLLTGETAFAVPSPKVTCARGLAQFTCHVPGDLMNDGIYSITVMIVKESRAVTVLNDALQFEIHEVERAGNWWGKRPGAVRPNLAWDCSASADSEERPT